MDSSFTSSINLTDIDSTINPSSSIAEDYPTLTEASVLDTYNNPNYKLEDDNNSKAYIFSSGLFKRELLEIIRNRKRQMSIKCTMYTNIFYIFYYIKVN